MSLQFQELQQLYLKRDMNTVPSNDSDNDNTFTTSYVDNSTPKITEEKGTTFFK